MRIYADFNGIAGRGKDCGLMLNGFGTLKDLSFYRIKLTDGLSLTFWDLSDEGVDIEVDAIVRFQNKYNRWLGEFDASHMRESPAGDRQGLPFLCFHCRENLSTNINMILKDSPIICPKCGGDLMYPIAPQEGAVLETS